MNKKVKYILSILLFWVIMIYFYTFLHEGGHAIIAIICGGKIDKFILGANAHVQTSGANYTLLSEALFHAAGVLLPVIFLIIALTIYKSTTKNTFYHIFYGFLCVGIASSLLAWVAIPLIALFTLPPVYDDATKFLNITGIHPFIVSLMALLIIVLLVFIAYKKGMLGKFKEIICEMSNENKIKEVKFLKLKLFIGIVMGVIAVIVVVVLISKPTFETSFSMEVSGMTEDVKVPFELKKSKLYNINLELTAKGILTDVQIYNENGIQVYQNICEWFSLNTSLNLEKGKYVLVLTFLQDSNDMQEHMKAMGYKFEVGILEQLEEIYNINNQDENYPITFSTIIN
jgi:hypothetical protein